MPEGIEKVRGLLRSGIGLESVNGYWLAGEGHLRLRKQACHLTSSTVHLVQKGMLRGVNNGQYLHFLQSRAPGAGWHAEAGWLMLNDGQKGHVAGTSEGR